MEQAATELDDRLLRVIELALRRLDAQVGPPRREGYELIVANFTRLRESLWQGRLSPIGSGTGFGAGRALSEWDLNDAELQSAVETAEDFYRQGA